MFRTVPAAILLVLIGLLTACNEDGGELTSAPANANAVDIEVACNSAPDICELIEALGPDPGVEKAFKTRFGNIALQLERDQIADTFGKTFDLIGDVLTKDLDDPNGSAPPTENEGKIDLVNLLLEFIGSPLRFPDGALEDENFEWQICEPGVKCVFETGNQFAGFSGTFTERTLVTIARLPDDPGPFEEFGFDDFPLFFDFSATSASDAMGPSAGLALASLAEPATIAVCVVDPPDPMAPPDPDVIALGHVIEGEEGSEVEILPDAPPGDFALDCEGASSTPPPPVELGFLRWWGARTASALEPVSDFLVSPLLANPGERRGLITAFSPVGAVDTTSVDDGGEGGPTTTTLTLNGLSMNVTISHGQTATATAVVAPAPGNELEPTVQFIFSQFSGGPGPPTSTKFLDDGEASVTVLCDALGTLTPPEGGVEITASRFVRAEFPGAGEGDDEFETSTSNTLILGCSAPIG